MRGLPQPNVIFVCCHLPEAVSDRNIVNLQNSDPRFTKYAFTLVLFLFYCSLIVLILLFILNLYVLCTIRGTKWPFKMC